MESAGVAPGDKIAIYAKNSARWGVAFFAIATADAVSVPILGDFTVDSAAGLTAHAECKLIFTEKASWEQMKDMTIEGLAAAIDIDTFGVLWSAQPATEAAAADMDNLLAAKYPQGITPKPSLMQRPRWTTC